MTLNDNARFASRPEARVRMERRCAITDAMHAIIEYRDTAHALALLMASVEKQARWSGDVIPQRPFAATFSTCRPTLVAVSA